MSERRLATTELADLVQTYGGILGAIEYGVRAGEIADPEIANAWGQIEKQYQLMSPNLSVIARLLYRAKKNKSELR
jgi:hypothetical protein